MMIVSICICTRKRKAGLKRLLESMESLQIPSDVDIRIIVVENDSDRLSESTINEFSSESKLKISYYLEPRQGIAYARNKSVKEAGNCDFCCFVDDDQIVASDWIIELLRCQREFNSDGVWGPNPPIFNKIVPSYIKQYHAPILHDYGTIVYEAATNCLLLRKKYLDLLEGPFDLRLNFTGGEDTYLTYLISKKGGVIRYNPNAFAYEIIPEDRSTIKYVIKSTFRISNSGLYVETLKNEDFTINKVLFKLILRFCNGLLIFIPFFLFGKVNKLKGLLKIIDAFGGSLFLLGKRNQFYKK
jgi:succinoglycan biosynthesis protein ExoM